MNAYNQHWYVEPKWYKQTKKKEAASWEKEVSKKEEACWVVPSMSESIAVQSEVLRTYFRIVDERDVKTLSLAAGHAREAELLVEARLRYAIHQQANRQPAPAPAAWFATKTADLADVLPSAKLSAGQLIAALSSEISLEDANIEIEAGPDGMVIVNLGHGCQWFVYAPRLPWPGCDARLYIPEAPDSPRLRAEHYRLKSGLIDATLRFLTGNVG
jgi:hypothetical protein